MDHVDRLTRSWIFNRELSLDMSATHPVRPVADPRGPRRERHRALRGNPRRPDWPDTKRLIQGVKAIGGDWLAWCRLR